MNKPTLEEFLKNWAICPKCKKIFIENNYTSQPHTDEFCMQLQLDYYCSGKTRPVTVQDFSQIYLQHLVNYDKIIMRSKRQQPCHDGD